MIWEAIFEDKESNTTKRKEIETDFFEEAIDQADLVRLALNQKTNKAWYITSVREIGPVPTLNAILVD